MHIFPKQCLHSWGPRGLLGGGYRDAPVGCGAVGPWPRCPAVASPLLRCPVTWNPKWGPTWNPNSESKTESKMESKMKSKLGIQNGNPNLESKNGI